MDKQQTHQNSPFLPEGLGKVNENSGNKLKFNDYHNTVKVAMNITPDHSDLPEPNGLIEHVEGLINEKEEAMPHAEILEQLLEQIEPIDFCELAFPESNGLRKQLKNLQAGSDEAKRIQKQLDKMEVRRAHYIILSIQNIKKIAEKNNWGLCKNHDFIYIYNGKFWAELDNGTFQNFLGNAAERMGVSIFSARYYKFKEELFKQFLSAAYLPTPEVDKDKVLINLQNGTFEITPQGTRLKKFDRSDFITYQLPFEHDPNAKAPLFTEYLNRVLPDMERQKVLAEYLGYIFIKHGSSLKLEAALILYGTGANGKSVFYEVTNALLGARNVSSYSLQELTDNSGYYRAMIANKLVNYASEINGKLEADKFKKMVSGEVIPARLPYGKPMELTNYAKFIFNCNELPKDVEHTAAYFRRWLIIPFDVTIPKEEQDNELHTKVIKSELSGVFNWVLEGLNRLLEQRKFSECKAAQQAVEEYKIESNSVMMFLNESDYKASAKNYKLVKDLYIEYRTFCQEEGVLPFKKSNFIKQLRASNLIIDRVSQNQLAVFIESTSPSF
jgi:putative DNA primase/helicase